MQQELVFDQVELLDSTELLSDRERLNANGQEVFLKHLTTLEILVYLDSNLHQYVGSLTRQSEDVNWGVHLIAEENDPTPTRSKNHRLAVCKLVELWGIKAENDRREAEYLESLMSKGKNAAGRSAGKTVKGVSVE